MKYNFCPDIRGFLSAFEAIHLEAWFPAMEVDWGISGFLYGNNDTRFGEQEAIA